MVKPMFGCHAIYVQSKMMLMLRCKEDFTEDNGVWVATTPEHKESLKEAFPTLRSIGVLGTAATAWQNLPQSSDTFEEDVLEICDLILKRDKRIGKIPKPKKKKR